MNFILIVDYLEKMSNLRKLRIITLKSEALSLEEEEYEDQEEDVDVITRQDVKIDGRSKAYRQHRAKLEAARAKRLEKRNQSKSKFIENIKSKVKQQEYAVPALSGLGIHATQPKTMTLPAMNTKSKKKSKSDDSEE